MHNRKANLVWKPLLLLIFLRPFICQMCYPHLDVYFCLVFLMFVLLWLVFQAKVFLRSYLNYPILFLLIALILSTLFSLNFRLSLGQIYKFIPYFVVFYLMAQATQKQKKQLLITLLSAAFLLSLYGIYQFFWGLQDVLDYLNQIEPYPYAEEFLSRERVFATFFSPDMFAGYLIIIIPLAVGLFLENLIKRKHLYCLLAGLSVSFMLFSFLLTKSIGGLISLMISFLVFSTLLFVFRPFLRPKILLITAIAGIVVVSMLAGLLLIRAEYFFDFSNPHNPIVQRFYFWKSATKMIKDFPLTGVGLGNFGLIYPQYQSPQAFATNFAHNSYLQIWAETGILGLIAWLWLGISSFWVGLRKLKVLQEQNYLLVGLLAASSGFLVHNLIDFSFFISEVAFHWWMILGLICFWSPPKDE